MPLTEISLTLEAESACQIFTARHIISADDPVDPRGEDEGPTPLEFLVAAIGSSAAISIRRAAKKLDLPLEEIQVSVKYRTTHGRLLDHGDPLPETSAAGNLSGTIQREIRIRVARDISGDERDALLLAAKQSPIDRIYAAAPAIEDALYVFGYANPDEGKIVG